MAFQLGAFTTIAITTMLGLLQVLHTMGIM
jgi:hypothetical protein